MKWFSSLPTRSKLFLSFGLMVVFVAVVVATAYTGIREILQEYEVVLKLRDLRADLNTQRTQILELILEADGDERGNLANQIKNRSKEIDGRMQDLYKIKRDDRQFISKLNQIQSDRVVYQRTRDAEIDLIVESTAGDVKKLGFGLQQILFDSIRSGAQELVDDAQKRANKRAQQATLVFVVAGLAALLMGVGMTVFLNRIISGPLQDISSAAERIAAGDLTVNVSCDHRRDEVGTLAQAFNRMSRSLQGMAGVAEQMAAGDLKVHIKPQSDKDALGTAFAVMVQNLQHMVADITEAVNVLGSSAGEIVASTTQLASTSSETATAVSETTTTVEEIRQTAQVANQKARHVAESAQHAARTSQAGKQSIEETGEGMQHIRQQMESIAQSMVSLSEQTQAIGDIIATVDDLAQQSNLLAVNASIEAAKAGEQGKGFAVVAQEVKNLADQSKQATMQVRAILNDIQKATGAAVMATEQGSKAVEAGVAQTAQAGESILTMADSIDNSAQAAIQIATSSQQQLIGMDQMVTAMESIKQASNQNVDSARQLEIAAQSLNSLGQRLRELVGRYAV